MVALQWSDLSIEEAEDLGATVGALIGLGLGDADSVAAGAEAGRAAGSDGHLIDDAEMWNVADSIEEGSAAVLALIEHLWAAPLRDAILEAGGIPVSDSWVQPWTSSRSVWPRPSNAEHVDEGRARTRPPGPLARSWTRCTRDRPGG